MYVYTRETLSPLLDETHRLIVPEIDLGRKEMQIRVKDWAMSGEHKTIGVVRIGVKDVIDVGHIDEDWFHLEQPGGAGFVGHKDGASEIALALRAEVVPVVLTVGVVTYT